MIKRATILLPVYNCEDYIKECLYSLINQTVSNFEILIINDGSTDNTVNVIKEIKDSRINLINNNENIKLIKTLNKGIDLIDTDYIIRMDADDVCEPNRIEDQIKFMDQNLQIGIAGSWFQVLGKNQFEKRPETHSQIKFHLFYNNCIAHPTVIMRTSTVKENKLKFSLNHLHTEDYELWVRALYKGVKFANIPKYLLQYRIHESQISSEFFEFQQNQISKIKLIQLEYIGIDKNELPKNNEHLKLLRIKDVGSLIELEEVKEWFKFLIKFNDKKNIFEPELFANYFNNNWYQICFDNTHLGFKTYKLYNSISISKKISLKNKMKFFVKCMLKRKHNKG